MFDAPGDYDPAIAAADNASKDTVGIGELMEAFAELDVLGLGAHEVTAPVLPVLGGNAQHRIGAHTHR